MSQVLASGMAESAPVGATSTLDAATPTGLRRCVALAIDLAIVAALVALAGGVFGVKVITSGSLPPPSGGFSYFTTATVLAFPWALAIQFAYFMLLEGLFRATPGKAIAGLRVVGRDGQDPGLAPIVVRNLIRPVDLLGLSLSLGPVSLPVPLLGGVVALFDRLHRRRLGDLAAGTLVVDRAAAPTQRGRTKGRLAVGACVALLGLGFMGWFDYYGRPPLVIQGLKNTGALPPGMQVNGYELGRPRWLANEVDYPVTYSTATGVCRGWLYLRWEGFTRGWDLLGASSQCGGATGLSPGNPSRTP